MNISICITVFNEEGSIEPLLDSLLAQSQKANEIVIVDGGSTDATTSIISNFQSPITNKYPNIKLLISKGAGRAEGRNLCVEIAKGDIIAMTDAGCVAQKDWLKNICAPLMNPKIEVSAGFYKMTGSDPVQKSMAVFLGTSPSDFEITFLPSTRSMAFHKSVWEKVGGFPEKLEGAAEDTVFNYKLVKNCVKIARVKNAVVEWGMPTSISDFYFKIYNYAKGDAESKIWFFPGKGATSHNIKALSVVLRYLIAAILFIYCLFVSTPLLIYWFIGLLIYLIWAFRKAGLWGIVLQIVSDLGVISGFISGIIIK